MSSKNYYMRFSTGNPADTSGLAPTFIVFSAPAGATTAPSISELSSTGIYTFSYECLGSIAFVADGATTGLTSADRYVVGALDISDRNDQFIGDFGDAVSASTLFGLGNYAKAVGDSNIALGTTNVALGTSNIALGTTNVALGTTAVSYGVDVLAQGSTLVARIGTTSDVIGDNSTDPTTTFGFLKRCQEYLEGDSTYTKASGSLTNYDRAGATTTVSTTIADGTTVVTKS